MRRPNRSELQRTQRPRNRAHQVPESYIHHQPNHSREEIHMDQTLIIRVVAAVLFVVILGVLIQRRRTQVK